MDEVVARFITKLRNSMFVRPQLDLNAGKTDVDGHDLGPWMVTKPRYYIYQLHSAMHSAYNTCVMSRWLGGGTGKQLGALYYASKMVLNNMRRFCGDREENYLTETFLSERLPPIMATEADADKILKHILKIFFAPHKDDEDIVSDDVRAKRDWTGKFRDGAVMYGIYALMEYKSKFGAMFTTKKYKKMASGEFSTSATATWAAFNYVTRDLTRDVRQECIQLAEVLTTASRGEKTAEQYVDSLIFRYGPQTQQDRGFISGLPDTGGVNIYALPGSWGTWSRIPIAVRTSPDQTEKKNIAKYLQSVVASALGSTAQASGEKVELKNWGA